jgi:hypothetical protein
MGSVRAVFSGAMTVLALAMALSGHALPGPRTPLMFEQGPVEPTSLSRVRFVLPFRRKPPEFRPKIGGFWT